MQQSPHESEQDHHGAWFAEAADAVLGNNFDAVAKSCFLTTLKLLDNVIQEPHNPVYRSVNLGNKTVQAKILWANGGWELLLACGFVPDESSEDRLVLPPNEQGGGTTRTLLSRCIAGRKLLANRLVKICTVQWTCCRPTNRHRPEYLVLYPLFPVHHQLTPAPRSTPTKQNDSILYRRPSAFVSVPTMLTSRPP
jgi:hypothetical protein